MQRYKAGLGWVEHGIKGSPMNPLQAAHIYGKPHLSEATKFVEIVGVTACDTCHRIYDRNITGYEKQDIAVRVPPAREAAVWRFLNLALGRDLKVLPSRREPPERPEAA